MKQKWNKILEFEEMLEEESIDIVHELRNKELTLVAMYAFYHYYNADQTKIEDVLDGMIMRGIANLHISGIYISLLEEESVDFVSVLQEDYYQSVFLGDIDAKLNSLAQKMAYVIIKTPYMNNEDAIRVYSSLDKTLSDDNVYTNRILCDFNVDIDEKIEIQRIVSAYEVKQKNIHFEILFRDDIEEEINDIESPKEYVEHGELRLVEEDAICYFGEERSFLSMISAKSLKEAFLVYGNKGLLDSNLRFFVSSKKIDPKIVDSIQNDSQNFCYYNNGVIITCDDYEITGKTLELKNFSIVNGGQTTNLIGRTEFDDDFAVICKVIKNKYEKIEKRVEFLAKVAEASNTQKPINAKDLIANRKEQRLLKLQFERAGIFLKVKRGEKIDKSIYKESWQNASNDEIAQFLYSMVYQSPGTSKNSKSKLLETEKIYRTIFDSSYQDGFFVSLQFIKVAYSEWLKKLKKTEPKSSTKFALAKNAFLIMLAAYGLVYKMAVNMELRKYLLSEVSISNNNTELKTHIQQNDIGQTNLFRQDVLIENKKSQYYALFEQLFGHILIPAYEKFKRENPTYAYSHFVKSDAYYYNFVIPQIINALKSGSITKDLLTGVERQKVYIDYDAINQNQSSTYRPGLEQEIIDLRKQVYRDSGGKIPAYEVITNRQLASLTKYLPKTEKDLARMCGFKESQIENYGGQILKIVCKYTNIDDIV